MDIKTAVTEGPVANFAAVRVKIAQSGPTVGADLVGILAAGISEGVARVLHQHNFASSGFHSSSTCLRPAIPFRASTIPSGSSDCGIMISTLANGSSEPAPTIIIVPDLHRRRKRVTRSWIISVGILLQVRKISHWPMSISNQACPAVLTETTRKPPDSRAACRLRSFSG